MYICTRRVGLIVLVPAPRGDESLERARARIRVIDSGLSLSVHVYVCVIGNYVRLERK